METLKKFYYNYKGELLAACLLTLFLLLYCSMCDVNAEETVAGVIYERVTNDGDVGERQVRQITTKIVTFEFTVNEIDTYIKMNKDKMKQFEDGIKELEDLRKAVFDEASKGGP